jgi:predicted KAP-like P-loop ATPase
MWADRESATDYLNFADVADAAVTIIRTPSMRPVSVGVFGDWGAGKSSLLQQIEAQLAPHSDVLVVKFDAWLFQGYDDARASLLEVIAQRLEEAADANTGLLKKTGELLSRVDGFRAMGLLAEGAATIAGIPTGGIIARGVELAGKAVSAIMESDSLTADTLEEGKALATEAAEEGKGLIKARKRNTPPQQIAAFRKLYGEILTELDKTLVVFIDNLDRCLPKQAIQTLEAIRLFLFLPNTAFVIAADEHMIRDAVADQYHGLSERHKTDYLDKLIQVPLHVPKASEADIRAYLYLLFAEDLGASLVAREKLRAALSDALSQSWHKNPLDKVAALAVLGTPGVEGLDAAFDLADRLAPLLAKSSNVRGNPRIVKRLLNTVRQRESIAKRRSIAADASLIAKLAVFERCAGPNPTVDLYRLIDENAGKPAVLVELEKKTGNDLPDGCPESWTKQATVSQFILEWAKLTPSLENVDLRALVYLSRETLPLGIRSNALPPQAREALAVLLKTDSLSSPAASKHIAALDASDVLPVLDGVLTELRKVTDWSTRPQGFAGALLLASKFSEASASLKVFVRERDLKAPWFKALTKNFKWA